MDNTIEQKIEETKRQRIVAKDNETPEEQRDRLAKLEKIWGNQGTRNECAFFQSLEDEEAKKKGTVPVNLYPEVFPNGVDVDIEKRTYKEKPPQ